MIVYMIKHAYNGGYYSSLYKGFKGYLYAEIYSSYAAAEDVILNNITEPCEIVKIYNYNR